jgi:hypothetical protein
MGPITWQIRDHAGLRSATELLHRAYKTALRCSATETSTPTIPPNDGHDWWPE